MLELFVVSQTIDLFSHRPVMMIKVSKTTKKLVIDFFCQTQKYKLFCSYSE